MLQLEQLFEQYNQLHYKYGNKNLSPIYGAGQIKNPKICLVFMNPTSKNVSSNLNWKGLKAPWLGTKNVWNLLGKLGIFTNQEMLNQIKLMKPEQWTEKFSEELYTQVASDSLFITNIAKCTQDNAKALPDFVYREHSPLMTSELEILNPKIILTLGNQVSSALLGKPISVSNYLNNEFEIIKTTSGKELKVYPAYYPVGQGMPNMPKTIARINNILATI